MADGISLSAQATAQAAEWAGDAGTHVDAAVTYDDGDDDAAAGDDGGGADGGWHLLAADV